MRFARETGLECAAIDGAPHSPEVASVESCRRKYASEFGSVDLAASRFRCSNTGRHAQKGWCLAPCWHLLGGRHIGGFGLTAGPAHDAPATLTLLDQLDPRTTLFADKAYDGNAIRNLIEG